MYTNEYFHTKMYTTRNILFDDLKKNMMSYFNMLKITPLNDLGVPDSKFQTNHPNSDRKITKF